MKAFTAREARALRPEKSNVEKLVERFHERIKVEAMRGKDEIKLYILFENCSTEEATVVAQILIEEGFKVVYPATSKNDEKWHVFSISWKE